MRCNLTKKNIIYPVIGSDGYIYEHIQILLYLLKYNKSPKTEKTMTIYDIVIYKG